MSTIELDRTAPANQRRVCYPGSCLFQGLVEQSRDVIAVLDGEGVFTYVSPVVEELSGFTPQQIVGHAGFEFVHPDDVHRAARYLQQIVATDQGCQVLELRVRTSSGEWIWIEVRAVNRLADDAIRGIVVNYHDITERVRNEREKEELEAQLAQAQKMEAVGQLAGGVAHDFNNLLAVILNYAQFVIDDVPDQGTLREDVEAIQHAGNKAADLVRQLLTFSRKEITEPEVVDVDSVISGLTSLLRRSIGEDIDLRIHPSGEVASTVIDPGQLEQVVMNLVVNARDAMPDGGSLTITTAHVDVPPVKRPGLPAGPYVHLSIGDTGTGIDEEVRRHIFEPFFTTKPRGEGTGLGLATAYGIVKAAEGAIYVESEPGRGTTFDIYLPRTQQDPHATPHPSPHRTERLNTETVLLVEDSDDVRHLARRILLKRGFRVLAAASGGEALEAYRRSPDEVDLLLTDVVMPGMSGNAVAHKLTRARPDLPVLYMSGYTDEIIARRGILRPGEALIKKPFTAEQLVASVRRLLDTEAQTAGAEDDAGSRPTAHPPAGPREVTSL